MGAKLASIATTSSGLVGWERAVVYELFSTDGEFPHLSLVPSILRLFFGSDVHDSNFFVFVADLHLRMILIGFFVLGLGKLISSMEERCYARPYRRGEKLISRVRKMIDGKESVDEKEVFELVGQHLAERPWSQYNLPKANFLLQRLSECMSIVKDSYYHPWASVTAYNRSREILMADVLTKEGSQYSGKLIRWIPNGLELGALGLEYTLRYYAAESVPAGPTPQTPWAASPKPASKFRKKVLIKNHGEMVIPASDIVTVHIWEMRKRFILEMTIYKLTDIEVLKWHLLLAFSHEDLYELILIQIALPEAKKEIFREELDEWIDENGLSEIFDTVFVQVIFLDDEPQAAAPPPAP